MQDAPGITIMRYAGLDPADPVSFVLLDPEHEGSRIWMNSDAVLHLWSGLGWPWKASLIFKLIPRVLRDPIYKMIACNRYKWFGKREECWVPSRNRRREFCRALAQDSDPRSPFHYRSTLPLVIHVNDLGCIHARNLSICGHACGCRMW